MNSWEFDLLKMRIMARLRTVGPATTDKLASELNAPHGNVRFALEQLRSNQKSVTRLAFGFWELSDELSSGGPSSRAS